jgi:hypothetical protein
MNQAVVVLFDVDSDPADVVAEGVSLARANVTRLELVAVRRPIWTHLSCIGFAAPVAHHMTPQLLDQDLARKLRDVTDQVPQDVLVRSRLLPAGWRQAYREVENMAPSAVLSNRPVPFVGRLFGGLGLRSLPPST